MKDLFILFIATILVSCQTDGKQTANESTPYFNIVLLSDYYTTYLKALETDSTTKDELFKKKVKEPIFEKYFAKSEYNFYAESFTAPDTTRLPKAILSIDHNRKDIENIISATFVKCNQYLKNDSVTFYILPTSADTKQMLQIMGGVTGFTIGRKQILLTIDPEVNSWKEVLAAAVAHEFNHAYWTNTKYNRSYKWTLLRYLVLEGKADSFAHLLYPDVKLPWTSALTEKEKTELWKKIKPELSNEDPSLLTGVMFGSEKYPLWGGYTLGYDIVQTAFKNKPELTPKDRTDMEAEKILEMSTYK